MEVSNKHYISRSLHELARLEMSTGEGQATNDDQSDHGDPGLTVALARKILSHCLATQRVS